MDNFKKFEEKNKGFIYFVIIVILSFLVFEGLVWSGVVAVEFPFKPVNEPFWTGELIDNVQCDQYTGSLYVEGRGVWYLVTSNGEVPMSGGEGSPLPKYQRMYASPGRLNHVSTND